MADPRKYTNALADMVDSGIMSADAVMNAAMSYMSEDDVRDMIRANGWLDLFESEESPDDDEEEAEITVGSTVTVESVEYVTVSAKTIDDCEGCDGYRHCRLLPDCDGIIFVRKEGQ